MLEKSGNADVLKHLKVYLSTSSVIFAQFLYRQTPREYIKAFIWIMGSLTF